MSKHFDVTILSFYSVNEGELPGHKELDDELFIH